VVAATMVEKDNPQFDTSALIDALGIKQYQSII
jgi:hypothetical protein